CALPIWVRYMIDRGYQRIAHLSGIMGVEAGKERNIGKIGKDRNLGYRDALKEAGFEIDESAIVEAGDSEKDGYTGFANLIDQYGLPEAVFCVTYPVGLGALQYMKDHNIDPDEIAILSFGSSQFNRNLSHPFICIDQPAFNLGQRAFERLISEIEADEIMDPELISLPANVLKD